MDSDRPFFGIELKLARGRLHAETLSTSITEWLQQSPLSGRTEYFPDRCGYQLILEPFVKPPLTEHWGLLIGDCVHNLRSALDNLCYALARVKKDPPDDPRGIYFPIFDDATRFERDAARTMKQLPELAAEWVTRWQPFHRVDPEHIKRDALNLLKHLSNEDKHKLPQVVLTAINQRDHMVQLHFNSDEDAAAFVAGPPRVHIFGGPVKPGTPLIEVKGDRPISKMQGQVTVEAVPAIQTLTALEGAMPTMKAVVDHAWMIFDTFRQFYPLGDPR